MRFHENIELVFAVYALYSCYDRMQYRHLIPVQNVQEGGGGGGGGDQILCTSTRPHDRFSIGCISVRSEYVCLITSTVQPGMSGKLLYKWLAGDWLTRTGIGYRYCT